VYFGLVLVGATPQVLAQAAMSKQLNARMQGKTCFNFTATEPALFRELDTLTAASIAAFKKAAFIA